MPAKTMACWSTPPKENRLGFLLTTLCLFGTINVSQVEGQSAFLAAAAFDSNSCRNNTRSMIVTYFGDTQNTSAIGADRALPQCYGSFAGQFNLTVRLENTNTGLVLQEVGPFRGINGLLWDTSANATLTPSLTGSYVCRLYQNSMLVVTSRELYQLNVVVPMNVTCHYPPSLKLESKNVLSCTVTGYPLPSITWSQVNGATISPPQPPLNVGIHQITSTMSVFGNQTGLEAGSFVTINTTVQYPSFACTPLQKPSIQMNICNSTPTNVAMSSGPLQIVARCPTFDNASFSPRTPPSTEHATQFNIACAPGYTGSSANFSLRCQAVGTWTTFPMCREIDECASTLCQSGGTCMDRVNAFSCLCQPGYTGPTCATYDACSITPCTDTSSTCRDTGNRNFACDCPAGTTGDGVVEGGCVAVRPTTATTRYQSTEISATTSTTLPTTVDAKTSDWVIAVSVVVPVIVVVIAVLIVLYCRRKKRSSPAPREAKMQTSHKTPQPQANHTMNAYEDAATRLPNAMTESSAYNDFIQPNKPIQCDYAAPR